MRFDTRIPLLILICLGLGPLQAAQQQGQILVHRESPPRTDETGNSTQGLGTPILGFVNGADQGELRALLGIPGASALGEPLSIPTGVMSVYFAPAQNYALLAPTSGRFIGLMTFQGEDEGPVVTICGAIAQPDVVVFSPNGASAALYSKAEERLQVVSGLPDSPQSSRVIFGSELPDEVRFLAVADDGATLVEGTVHSALYLLPPEGSPRLLYTAGDLQGMAFAPRTTDLVAFDGEAGAAFLLQEINGSSSYLLLADGLTGLSGSVFLQTGSVNTVIASTNSSIAWEINLRNPQVQKIQLPGMPQMLQPLRTSGDYLLFYRTGLPAWILDSNGPRAVVSLVPARTVVRRQRNLTSMSANGGLTGDSSEQPNLAGPSGLGAGCIAVPEPTPAPKPQPLPVN